MAKLAVIIPTKDRHDDLITLLGNILAQSVKPVQIIVVDGGNEPAKKNIEEFTGLTIDYVRCFPPSLTTQRNLGIKKLRKEAEIAAFLDDDVILEQDAIKNMLDFWDFAPSNTAGAAFNLENGTYRKPNFIEKFFIVNGDLPSKILCSGFQTKVSFQEHTTQVDWLVGCVMTWKTDIFKEYMFDEWFTGYARYEEVDFCYRVGNKYKLYIVSNAIARHPNFRQENIDFSFALGKMEVINRIYFVMKNPGLSLSLCIWGCFGIFLNNMIKSIVTKNVRYPLRAKGNLAGFFQFLFRRHLFKAS